MISLAWIIDQHRAALQAQLAQEQMLRSMEEAARLALGRGAVIIEGTCREIDDADQTDRERRELQVTSNVERLVK
jgi:hypothetical protein